MVLMQENSNIIRWMRMVQITLTPNGTGVVAIEGSMNPSVSSTGKALNIRILIGGKYGK